MSLSLTIKPFQLSGFTFDGAETALPPNSVTNVGIVRNSKAVVLAADGTPLDGSILWLACVTTDATDAPLVVHHDLLAQMDGYAASAGGTVQEIPAGGGFTPGVTTVITSSTLYATKSAFQVYFDGVLQAPSTYDYDPLTGQITFHAPIPSGVGSVMVSPAGGGAGSGSANSITSPLLVNGSAGIAGQCLVSQGTDKPPAWAWVDAVPIGGVVAFAVDSVPTGWLQANGGQVSRTGYAELFDMIGTTYGAGNGTTTFGLPDLRGEFIRGADAGRGVDSGRVVGSSQGDAFKAHTHTLGDANDGVLRLGSPTHPFDSNPASGYGANHSPVISSTGGSETRPRNVAMVYCIKATSAAAAAGSGGGSGGDNTLPRKAFSRVSSVGGVLTLDLDATTGMFYCALTENITSIVVIYTPSVGVADEEAHFQLVLVQNATPRTVALPASFKSMSGTYAAAVANKTQIIEAVSYNAGVSWLTTFAKEA